ncbi:MAG TPA: antibiotic biosynthesis monooxygenase family protein, partial [Mycobacterium sp.]|nr:antibiotic biosynthesis monooxygenase family protein [Mycobacterium sp.]
AQLHAGRCPAPNRRCHRTSRQPDRHLLKALGALVNTTDESAITFINVFDIPADGIDTFISQWEHRSRLISSADGFISAELHRAIDAGTEFQLINVSKWRSRAHFEAATHAPEFRRELDSYASAPSSTWTAHRGIYHTAVKLD